MSAYRKNLYGDITSAIAEVGSLFWLAVLRKLTKSVIQNCYGCKGSEQCIIQMLNQGSYCEIELALPFEIVGTDHAGPLYYKFKGKKDLKPYILLFYCSVSRAIHLELVLNLTTKFIISFKRLISRRQKPVYSNNTKPFETGAKWLNSKDEHFHDFFLLTKRLSGNSTFQGHHVGRTGQTFKRT